MLLGLVGIAITAQLNAADVSIHLHGDSATVDARYQITTTHAVDLVIIRISGQDITFSSSQEPHIQQSPGLYRLTVPRSDSPTLDVVVRYVVNGNLSRIPIAVPELLPPLEGASVDIRVSGLEPGSALRNGFPRLFAQTDGSALAELESLPGMLRVPPLDNQVSVNLLADTSVALLVLFATLFWLLRRRAHKRRQQAAGAA